MVHCYAEEITESLNMEAQFRQVQKMESVGQLAQQHQIVRANFNSDLRGQVARRQVGPDVAFRVNVPRQEGEEWLIAVKDPLGSSILLWQQEIERHIEPDFHPDGLALSPGKPGLIGVYVTIRLEQVSE